MLRACRRVLKPGGRIAFFTIFIPSGLSPADYRRAVRIGSPGVASWGRQQADLLRTAGFTDIEELDCTDEYLRITRAWLAARQRHQHDLAQAEGAQAVRDRIKRGRASVVAIESGLLRRGIFLARRPS